jgi:chaperonin GroES
MITPLNDRVIIKRNKTEETSAGGIVLPGDEREIPTTGIVIAVADSAEDKIAAGDTVMFGKYAGSELKVNGETVLIVKFDELIAKVG